MLCFSLQRILGITSLDAVLDQRYVNPQNIIHNMTKVNKHGVVTLDDKTSMCITTLSTKNLDITSKHKNHYSDIGGSLHVLFPVPLKRNVIHEISTDTIIHKLFVCIAACK